MSIFQELGTVLEHRDLSKNRTPTGPRNGNWRHGCYSADVLATRRFVSAAKATLRLVRAVKITHELDLGRRWGKINLPE
jgi:hypothetical protein